MSTINTIPIEKLVHLVGTPRCPSIIDVQTDEDFATDSWLIPGAVRRCVAWKTFLVDHVTNHRANHKGLKRGLAEGTVFSSFLMVQMNLPKYLENTAARFATDDGLVIAPAFVRFPPHTSSKPVP